MAFVRAWNAHCIPGVLGGIPEVLARVSNSVSGIASHDIPTTTEVIALFQSEGRRLTPEGHFGIDLLSTNPCLCALRDRDFDEHFPIMDPVSQEVLYGSGSLLQVAILYFVNINQRYQALII